LLAVIGIAVTVASPTCADQMAIFYARWAGHGASTPGTSKLAVFSFTVTVAASTSADLTAMFYTLRTSHVTSTAGTVACAVSSCITLARRRAASAAYLAGRGERDLGKHKWQQSDEQW